MISDDGEYLLLRWGWIVISNQLRQTSSDALLLGAVFTIASLEQPRGALDVVTEDESSISTSNRLIRRNNQHQQRRLKIQATGGREMAETQIVLIDPRIAAVMHASIISSNTSSRIMSSV